MIRFACPEMFLLILLPLLFRYLVPAAKGLHGDALRVPFLADIRRISVASGGIWGMSSAKGQNLWRLFPIILIWLLLAAAAARPQLQGEPQRLNNQGRDILLVVDISTSMLQKDFGYQGGRLSRLSAVKAVISDFIQKRADDRLGLILFGTRAYLQAPITYDKKSVGEILWNTDAGMAGDTTSIGDALGLALKTLKDSPDHDKKVIILLTDGENNDGSLSMAQTMKLAEEEGIKIYTVGVGAPNAFFTSFFGVKLGTGLDEDSLKQLAAVTKGNYFRAENTGDLLKVYQTIDKLEARAGDENFVVEITELYYWPLLLAALLSMAFVYVLKRRG